MRLHTVESFWDARGVDDTGKEVITMELQSIGARNQTMCQKEQKKKKRWGGGEMKDETVLY